MSVKDKYAIVGVGHTKLGRTPGYNSVELSVMAIRAALEDAGLSPKDLDCVFTKAPTSGFQFGYAHAVSGRLGIEPRVCATLDQMGSTGAGMLMYIIGAMEQGLCDIASFSYGDNPITGYNPYLNMTAASDAGAWGKFAASHGYALVAQRHMYEYGTTSKQLGAVAVATRNHGAMNPDAQMQKHVTLEDHQNSRIISDPLRLLDCCLVSDGAAAVIITSVERAKNMRKKPVYIMGFGQAHRPTPITFRENITESPGKRSGEAAFKMAGVTPKDIDVAELYDCFTIVPLITLEDYGFCKKGEGGAFVEGGRIELGGEIPINTHGGLLSCTGMPGIMQYVEATRQLRGECGPRQVKDAEIALVSQQGGVMDAHGTIILRR